MMKGEIPYRIILKMILNEKFLNSGLILAFFHTKNKAIRKERHHDMDVAIAAPLMPVLKTNRKRGSRMTFMMLAKIVLAIAHPECP